MGWMEQLGGLLQRYAGANAAQAPPEVHDHFDQVAQAAPPQALAGGIASAFRSDQTPPFGQMVSQLFGQSNPQQRAGLLNTLLATAGPSLLQQFGSGTGGFPAIGQGQVTPEQASQMSPTTIEQIASQAGSQNPSVIDRVSGFYSQHPTLVKALGAGALAVALSHMAGGGRGGQVAPASQDPYGDPANQQGVAPASQDPYGDPADQEAAVAPASQDPYGDPGRR